MYIENRELVGTLMKLSEDPLSRFTFEIWFNYTKKGMNEIREGTLVVAPNFASNASIVHAFFPSLPQVTCSVLDVVPFPRIGPRPNLGEYSFSALVFLLPQPMLANPHQYS